MIPGLTTQRSAHTAGHTADRLDAALRARGLTIFARIDHAAGAAQAGLALRATEVFLFGNASGGTPLMQARQTIGIDLPLKALIWEDDAGVVWLGYNDPAWLAQRHGIDPAANAAVQAMTAMLAAVAGEATAPPPA